MPPADGSTQQAGRLCCDDYIPYRTVGVQRDGVYDPGCGAGATIPGYRYSLSTFLLIPAASTVIVVIRPRESGIVLAMLMDKSGPDIVIDLWEDARGKQVGIEGADQTNGITDAWDPANFGADILRTPYNPLPPNLGPISPRTGMELTVSNTNSGGVDQFFSALTWILRPKNAEALEGL